MQRLRGPSAAVEAPATAQLATTELDWNPRTEVDPEQYETKRLVVVAPRASLCPSEEEALGEGCGNSNEWEEGGYWMERGQSVLIIDEPPQRGVYRTFRYMVSGIFPAWVRADALASRPLLDEEGSRAFAQLIERNGVVELALEALRAAPMNESIVLRDVPAEALALLGGSDVHLELSLSVGGEVVAELRAALERADGALWIAQHTCVTYGNCETLSYGEVPGVEDRVTMELVRTEGEPGQPPRFEVRALLDRYGYFTKIDSPES